MTQQSQLQPNMPSQTMFDDQSKKAPSFAWVQWFQSLVDLLNRVRQNRLAVTAGATAIALTGAIISSGVGTAKIMPKRYAEFLVQARATFNLSAAGTLYVYVYRSTVGVPANGAAPNAGDVAVAGDAFAGPATSATNVAGALSAFDTGLSQTQGYFYYLAVKGTNGLTGNLVAGTQLMASEL